MQITIFKAFALPIVHKIIICYIVSNRSAITKQWLDFNLDIIAFSSVIGHNSGFKLRVPQVITSNAILLTTGGKQVGLSKFSSTSK